MAATTPGSVSLSKGKAKAPRALIQSLLIIAPCIVLLFFLGVYAGSTLVTNLHERPAGLSGGVEVAGGAGNVVATGSALGVVSSATGRLPGTKNILAVRRDEEGGASKVVPDGSIDRTLQAPITTAERGMNTVPAPRVMRTHSSASMVKETGPAVVRNAPATVRRPQLAETTSKTGNLRGHVEKPVVDVTRQQFPQSFHVTGTNTMVVNKPLDSANILVGAWVHLDKDDLGNDRDMRTVFTNKAAGCDNHPQQYGLSLYINAWQEHEHRVHVEYGSTTSGCHKVSSLATVSLDKWFHVAVAMHTDPNNADRGITRIYVDGSVVATSTEDVPPHALQQMNKFFVGRYDGGGFPFEGNISHLAVVHPSSPIGTTDLDTLALKIMDVGQIDSVPGLVAHYPLEDSLTGKGKSTGSASSSNRAVSIAGQRGVDGTYMIPKQSGKRAFGLKVPLLDGTEGLEAPSEASITESDTKGRTRAAQIKEKMKWIWDNYHKHAWGRDELKPVSHHGNDPWGSMGVTLVDTLDTLWLMDLKEEFWQARDWVRDRLSFGHAGTVSVFETTIRELGGLLAAYDLSKDPAFLNKAKELGDKLAPAFGTSTGVAWGMVDFHSGRGGGGWAGSSAILSEFGTLQIEFRNLAAYTHNPHYENIAMRGLKFAKSVAPPNGLFPIKMDINSGRFTDHTITFGALGDSFYEYLLKVWIQGGKQEQWLRDMYDRSMDGVMNELLAVADPDGLVFVADLQGRAQHRKMDHLVCFLPGLLALGAHTDPTGKDSTRAKRDMAVAKALMYTCREMYHRQPSGISPEYVEFPPGGGMKVGSTAPFYILRPETAESLFILNQLTGDPIYREWAWEIWQAIDKHCKAPYGYGALRDVRVPRQGIDDRMESFFTAETVKYLWLAQNPDKPVDLDQYVFNTEAHPTKIFTDHKPVPGP